MIGSDEAPVGWAFVLRRARLADTAISAAAVLVSMLCLVPLFDDLRWVLPAVMLVAVVAVLGAAGRAIALPIPLIPIVELLGVIAMLTGMFAATEAWARFAPTSEAWSTLRLLTREGLLDAQELTAPAPTLTGLVLLAVGGVAIAALCTDTLFVSVRSPLLAGLPLLSLYLAPAFINVSGAPWWTFPLPAAGWLLILAADQRDGVREWSAAAAGTPIRGLSPLARRVGAVAIAVAMVAAIVVPVRAVTPWRTAGDAPADGTSAAGGSVILDPLVSMRRSLIQSNNTEVLTYRTDDPDPSYLRVTALEGFDGITWRPRAGLESGRAGGITLPGPVESQTGGRTSTYDITVRSLENAYLPLPYPITELSSVTGLGEGWLLDWSTGVAFSGDRAATGLAYQVTAIEQDIEAGDLRGAGAPDGGIWPQLSVPSDLAPVVERTARRVTADAETPYDRALLLQRWFTRDGGFEYSTSVRSGAGADYVAEFLRDKVGYCEQFAGSMALMARTLGIPSRVVVGFTQGSQTEDGAWRVSVRDAHAWPELWFDGVGWVRFEPTPRSGGSVSSPAYAPTPDREAANGPDDAGERPLRDDGAFDVDAVPSADAAGSRPWPWALLGALLVVGLAVLSWPMARRLARRRRRLHGRTYADTVEGAWAEIGDSAVDAGQPWSPFATPRQQAERLGRGMTPTAAAALQRLRAEVEQVRYAPPRDSGSNAGAAVTPHAERSGAVRADVAIVRAELRGRVRWQVRVVGYCWPPSERRRQRSSMRSMKPGDLRGRGAAAAAAVGADSSAGRVWKAE